MRPFNKNPTPRELHQFALTLIAGFTIIALLLWWRHRPMAAERVGAAGIAAGILSLLAPSFARALYRLWMAWGHFMGQVTSRLILGLIYFMVLTPVALFFRWRRRDVLKLRRTPAESYWTKHPSSEGKDSYQHLF